MCKFHRLTGVSIPNWYVSYRSLETHGGKMARALIDEAKTSCQQLRSDLESAIDYQKTLTIKGE